MTYNIHHGANVRGRLDLEATAETIRRAEADVVALQEVDRRWGLRSMFRDRAARLALAQLMAGREMRHLHFHQDQLMDSPESFRLVRGGRNRLPDKTWPSQNDRAIAIRALKRIPVTDERTPQQIGRAHV